MPINYIVFNLIWSKVISIFCLISWSMLLFQNPHTILFLQIISWIIPCLLSCLHIGNLFVSPYCFSCVLIVVDGSIQIKSCSDGNCGATCLIYGLFDMFTEIPA